MSTRSAALAALIPAALSACSSPDWTRGVVDSTSPDVGMSPSLDVHRSGNSEVMGIAYVDSANDEVKYASRSGTSNGWGGFERETVACCDVRLPALVHAPNGRPHVFFVRNSIPGVSNGTIMHAVRTNTGPAGYFECIPGQVPSWYCKSVTILAPEIGDPITALYEVRAGSEDRLHVVWADYDDETLWHATKQVSETSFKVLEIGKTTNDDDDDDIIRGDRPILFRDDDDEGVNLIFTNEGAIQQPRRGEFRSYGGGFGGWSVTAFEKWKPGDRDYAIHVIRDPALGALDSYWYVLGDCSAGSITLHAEDSLIDDGNAGIPAPIFSPNVYLSCDPDLTHDPDGFIHAVSYRSALGALDHYRYNPLLPAWSGKHYEIIDNGAAEVGLTPKIFYSPVTGELIVVYYDKSNGRLKLATRKVN
ncbi:hypothetical protein DEA8626_00951 [Defluviimonas aquaemixtae]|uniref:Uncharacterized protein n=1 Tax=Albidovulum aquaemixtae TaxID=1542388 RepID=A0A2R8B4J2_9RHOB|nr:hypothetical protein [Defluviimonas aquaemixtae]SPH17433.1 hypothetical protein DEA8626_00951 [Defluviimonas aquaemixtae]